MIEVTDEMIRAAQAATRCNPAECDECIRWALSAALAIAERDLREQIADALEDHAIQLRGAPFRRGDVGIEFICGIEDAAGMVRTEKIGTP